MRNPDGTLIGDLNDDQPALTSGSIGFFDLSTTDENQTVYDLLPVFVNKPPIIISPISEASDPPIKPYSTADASGNAMYLFPDGSVKVMLGATFTFKLVAQQPSILNVENGIPTMIPPNQGLTYVWRKDGELITSYELESLQSSLVVSGSTLKITNIQPEHAGSYICEVQNDIGTTTSETINLEVLNLDFDEYFYKNLVRNPYGKEGTDEWEFNNDDFTTKQFSEKPSEDFKRPNRIDLTGYTQDMLHPRPYQIDTGVLRGFNMVDDLVKSRGSYFTRARYKYIKKGGTSLIRAYQDIDVTDIQALIKGGVFGVEGVRAIFGCYIGNAVNKFIPTTDIIPIKRHTDIRYYISSAPRLSVENTLTAGPPVFLGEEVFITIEEYDNDIRLSSTYYKHVPANDYYTPQHVVPFDTPIENLYYVSNETKRIKINDPWTSRKWFWYGMTQGPQQTKVYPIDVFGIGEVSRGDFYDMALLTAQDLYPDPRDRYTYGQYVEFKKLVLERLNPKTTKVRIVLNFSSKDTRIFETAKEFIDYNDEVFDPLGWDMPWRKNSWSQEPWNWEQTVYQKYKAQDVRNGGTDPLQFLPLAIEPGSMITALNFALLPILKQNRPLTNLQTNKMFVRNNVSASFVPNVLQGRRFDPMGILTNKWNLNFQMYACERYIDDQGFIKDKEQIEISIDEIIPGESPRRVDLNTEEFLPFTMGSVAYVESVNSAYDYNNVSDLSVFYGLKAFAKYRYISKYQSATNKINSPASAVEQAKYEEAANILASGFYMNDINSSIHLPQGQFDEGVMWVQDNYKARYFLVAGLPGTSESLDTSYYTNLLNRERADLFDYMTPDDFEDIGNYTEQNRFYMEHYFAMMGYYLDLDFSTNDVRVTLSRTRNSYPPFVGGTNNNPIASSGSFQLTASINDRGVLVCSLDGVATVPMSQGGMGYRSIGQTLPSNQLTIVANSTPVIPMNERTVASVITVRDHPVQCIRALRTNIGRYSVGLISQNYYYIQRVKEIVAPIVSDIDNFDSYTGPFDLGELMNFSASLNTYAFSNLPNFYSNVINLQNEPNPTQQINVYYTTTLKLDMADTTFANAYTIGLSPIIPPAVANENSRQTLRSPDLLRLRSIPIVDILGIGGRPTGEKVALGPSLIAVRPVDSDEEGSKVGSPSYGYKDVYNSTSGITEQVPYIVTMGNVGDKVAGTYL